MTSEDNLWMSRTVTRLFVIRHGETDANRELRFQGQVDVPLNAMGHEQARRLAGRLAALAQRVHIDRLYSSDLLRARETAAPAHPVLGVAQPLRELREQAFGVFDGLSVQQIEQSHADLFERWRRFDAGFELPGGESTSRFSQRVLGAFAQLASQHEGHTLCVVTHGGVLDMIYRAATGQPLDGPRQCDIPNAGVNELLWVDAASAGGRPELVSWADVAHLGGMPPQAVYRPAPMART